MFFKCEMLVGGYTYDVTDDLVNWDDVELAYKRDNYDGVVRSFSTKFEFANKAYSLLVSQWEGNYLASSASIVYYKRNNSWLWSEVFRCSLDFSTFSYNGTTCSINAVDSSLAALIKAKKGTQYEWVVSGMKEEEPLRYDGILMSSYAKWNWQGTEDEDTGDLYVDYSYKHGSSVNNIGQVPIYQIGSEVPFANRLEIYDGGTLVTDYGNDHQFTNEEIESYAILKSKSESELSIKLKIDLHLHAESFEEISTGSNAIIFIIHSRPVGDNEFESVWSDRFTLANGATTHIDVDTTLTMKKGDSLQIRFFIGANIRISQSSGDHEGDLVSIETTMRNTPQLVDVVKPSTLLNRLLKSMNGGQGGITGTITSGVDERLDSTYILAAESVRGLENAKLYSSYTKFCEWMSAEFGFVPVIDDANKTVTFAHRDSLFVASREKDLGDSCTDFEYEVDSSMIYSRVRVGYDKQDYDSVNGRDEFRFTNEYTTGVTLTDNSLELISPYRADAYGIEFLAAKRGEETTDDDSDTDVFFIGATLSANTGGEASEHEYLYNLIRGGDYAVTGVISPETMFNAMYSQRFMIAANAKYIGSSCSGLEYASSDGNSDVSIGGISEKADITLPNRLFTVGKLSVTTGDMDIPDSMDGSFDLVHNGTTYRGYLQDVSFNIGKGEDVKYTLIVWAIEEP